MAENFRLYYMYIASFFFISCEKKVFISDRLEAKTKIALT